MRHSLDVNERETLLHAAHRELYQEFQRRNLQRRLKLRPCLIQIQPTTQYWGCWNSKTRHIVIAEKLVTDYEWHDVVGVLIHEMAHQYADEILGNTQTAHGDVFQQACLKVGVPFYFAKSQVHLHQHTLDWRQTQPFSEEEKRLEKIRKLLNLASSANEHEASLAMNRVREIQARYQLEQISTHSGEFYHSYIKTQRKRLHTYEQKIMSILVNHYMVEVIVGTIYCPTKNTHLRSIELIGRKENVLMADYVFEFLKTYIQTKVLEKRKTTTPFPPSDAKAYQLGILTGFDEKLTQQLEDSESTELQQALTLFSKDPQMKDYVAKIHPRLISVSSKARLKNQDFFETGRKDGRSLTINRPLHQKSNKKFLGLLS